MAWTKEQMQCIEPQNGIHNILVSAGAGAGKTATLVEKIIREITSEKQDMGINEILCVTFTREAAREMKERIVLALEKLLRGQPNNLWLKRQLSLTETASIMTIDSFCLRLVKDHISDTEIDPAFRIADQAEMSVMWEKTMDEFLEKNTKKKTHYFSLLQMHILLESMTRGLEIASSLSITWLSQIRFRYNGWICADILYSALILKIRNGCSF